MTAANDKLCLGLIGAGNIGGVHLKNFGKLPDVKFTAISDVSRPLAEERAEAYGIDRVYADAEELIADPNVDAVIIGVPNKFHAPLAVQALKAGKHVLLEKPMGLHASDAKAIYRAYQESGKTLMLAHQMRWESVPMQIKEQAAKGALGSIYHAKTGWLRRKGIPGWGTWFTRKDMAGGGPLIDIGVHMLDLALHLMGSPKPVSVVGSTYAEFGPKRRGIGDWGTPNWDGYYDVEDLASAFIRMDNGSSLTLEVSWAVHNDNNDPYIQLMGSEGGASLRGNTGKLFMEHYDRPMETEIKAAQDEGPRVRLSRHFVDCVRENKEPLTSALSGLTNNLILEAIYTSSATGKEVEIDWSL